MSTKQYIGARYVLKIYENTEDPSSAEWQANVTYEPLIMVTYNRNSYISKKEVPKDIGNPAENPSYWAISGNYNGQIASLERAIETEKAARITNDETIRSALNTEISERESGDNSLRAALSTETTNRVDKDEELESAINDVKSDLEDEIERSTSTDASLQTQIDEIIAPSGEAPSAAEVQNARIGADGVTYNTLGNAIRNQISVLFSSGIQLDLGTCTDDYYVDNHGEDVSSNDSSVTDYIPILNGVYKVVKAYTQGARCIALYDSSKNFIDTIGEHISDVSTQTLTIDNPSAKYIRFTYKTDEIPQFMILPIASYKRGDDVNICELTWSTGGILLDGRILEDNTREHSDYIPCIENDVIKYAGETDHANIAGISFYDSEKHIITGIGNVGTKGEIFTQTAPANSAFFRISTVVAIETKSYAYIDKISAFDNNAIATNESKYEIGNVKDLKGSKEVSGSWEVVNEKEILGSFSLDDVANGFTVAFPSTITYRYAINYNDENNVRLYGTSWITEPTSNYIKGVDYGDNVASIEIRLQRLSGESTVNVSVSDARNIYMLALDKLTTNVIKNGVNNISVYVDGVGGDDDNTGLARNRAFKTIEKAISSGYKNILIKAGTYAPFELRNVDNIYIGVDHYYDVYNAGTDEDYPKVVIDGSHSSNYGINIIDSKNINIDNFEVKDCVNNGFYINRSFDININSCVAHDIYNAEKSNSAMGFSIEYSDVNCNNCLAYNIGTTTAGAAVTHSDGFNIHNTGTVNLVNCSAYNCEDDGVSHHDACQGIVDGGEWYNCGKGGVASPTHGAKVNVQNVYSHDNAYGLYAGNQDATSDRGHILLNSCVFDSNTTKDVYASAYYDIIAINCVYNTVSATNITRFPNN